MGLRISVVGAGSVSHGRRLLNDLFAYPWMDKATLSLMAPHRHHLTGVADYARRIVQRYGLQTHVEAHTDLGQGIQESDVLFLLYDAGGFNSFETDFRIASAFGVDLCLGDTMGPTGIMKAVRNLSVLKNIAKEIQRSSPNCLVISYVNPMAAMTMSAEQLGIRSFIGLCGGVEATKRTIAACLQEPPQSLEYEFAGINHMTWTLKIQKGPQDMYPLLREQMSTPEWLAQEPTRAEVLQHFGYFVTETSGHLSDFFPWFRRDAEVRRRYCAGPGYTGASGAYHRYSSYVHHRLRGVDPFEYEEGQLEPISDDYGSRVANAWLTGESYRCYANLPNSTGLIANLPTNAAVEVPTRVTRKKIRGTVVGNLPTQLAGLCESNIIVQRIAIEAARTKDPKLLLAAISMDPLTGATIDLPATRRLTEQLIAANRSWFSELEEDFSFRDVEIQSRGVSMQNKPIAEDVLEPVRRFDRQRRKLNEQRQDNEPNPD